jgi:hypothetical protein
MSLALLLSALFVPQSGLAMPVVGWVERVKIYPGEMNPGGQARLRRQDRLDQRPRYRHLRAQGQPVGAFSDRVRDGHGLAWNVPWCATKIQRHFGKRQRRPVVKLGVCVGALPGGPGQPGEPQRFHLPRC